MEAIPSDGRCVIMNTVNLFGGGWQRARKDHICWDCGDVIPKGDGYHRTAGTVNGRMFSVKHCRKNCECCAEMLDQNPHLSPAVFAPTLETWLNQRTETELAQFRQIVEDRA